MAINRSRAGRAAASAARASSSRRSSRACERLGASGPHGGELVTAGVGQLDPDRARVGGVGGLADQAVGLEPADQAGHRRLGDALGRGQLGDPLRAVGRQPGQHQQRADAAAAVGLRPQQLREVRQAALELYGEIFDSQTI